MNEQPLVSIGVPIAKCAYLREALACWTEQTYENFEVLLSDDAAPGDVRGIVEPYLSDARFTYVRQEVNSAPHFTRNWNACLERAKGKYFVLASDDGLYAPNFLERMVALAEAHPEGDIFFAGWTMLTRGGSDGWVRTPCGATAGLGKCRHLPLSPLCHGNADCCAAGVGAY